MGPFFLHALLALAPVIVCLIIFEAVDAFKLVSLGEILALVAGGAALAAAGYFANGGVLDAFPMRFGDYTRYGSPVVEETLKGLLIVGLFAFNRVGYLIDAAIAGFAVGSGFALTENLFYLHEFVGASGGVWLVRGFGTAIMHGGASAIFSASALALFAPRLRVSADRFRFNPLLFLPGLAGAILMHGAFNHFHDAALEAMAIVVLAVPLGLFVIFSYGDTYAHRWLAEDRETHEKLLNDLRSGAFAASPAGQALQALADRLGAAGAKDLVDLCAAQYRAGGPRRRHPPESGGSRTRGPQRRGAEPAPRASRPGAAPRPHHGHGRAPAPALFQGRSLEDARTGSGRRAEGHARVALRSAPENSPQ